MKAVLEFRAIGFKKPGKGVKMPRTLLEKIKFFILSPFTGTSAFPAEDSPLNQVNQNQKQELEVVEHTYGTAWSHIVPIKRKPSGRMTKEMLKRKLTINR